MFIYKTVFVSVLLVSFSVFPTTSAATAGDGEVPVVNAPLYVATRTDAPPQIDGNLEEAVWRHVRRAPIERRANSLQPDLRNRVGYWMSACDATNLYLAFEVEDRTFFDRALEGVMDYNNDSIELFFDVQANYRVNLQYRLWPLGRDGRGAEVTLRPTWGQWTIAGCRIDGGYTIEVAIPFTHFREAALQDIHLGSIMGFDVAVVDQRVPTGGKSARVVTSWSGDGTNWQYAEQNGLLSLGDPEVGSVATFRSDFRNRGETPAAENGAIWPDLQLVNGRFHLEVLHQSSSASHYQPWRLGEVNHPLLQNIDPADTLISGTELGAHSGGEHLNMDPRPVETVLAGRRGARSLELKVVNTPFHPATRYETNADWISFFNGMETGAGPAGPASLMLPLNTGRVVRSVNAGSTVLYDTGVDGPLVDGGLLVTFVRSGDGRDFDLPMALFPSRAPSRIERNEQGGITLRFASPRATGIALLPLYGLAPITASRTEEWTRRGSLPDDVADRLAQWQAWSVRIPVGSRQNWQYIPGENRFHVTHSFDYTPNLSEWGEAGELLAMLPPMFWRPDAAIFYRCAGLADLDYATWFGPIMGVKGTATLDYSIPAPRLADAPPRLDRELLSQSERGRKYMDELKALDAPLLLHRAAERRMKLKGEFMPHAFPLGTQENVYAALPLEHEASLHDLRVELLGVHRDETFNPAKRDQYFPSVAPYLGSSLRYARLTYPYGVAEPYYGITATFFQVYRLGEGLGDQSLLLDNWSEVKRISEIIWTGGFVEYRYDGGTLLGTWLLGLYDLAQKKGDEDYAKRVLFRLAEHGATARSFFAARGWLSGIGAWDTAGNTPLTLGEIQMRTRNGFAAMTDRSAALDYSYMWDRSFGNSAILIPFALDVVTDLEKRADEIAPEWYLEKKPHWKRCDGIVRRFETRALVLREPLAQLETYLTALRKPEHLGPGTAYAACVAAYLQRLQLDVAAGQP